MCPAEAFNLLLAGGTIALTAALVAGTLALLAIITRPVGAAAEGPLGRFAGRHLRARHRISPDAPRWACRACHSVNEATAAVCYSCGAPAAGAAQPIPPAADETWRPPAPRNRFDPSRYRGPGAPEPDAGVGDEQVDLAARDPAGPGEPAAPATSTGAELPAEPSPPADAPRPPQAPWPGNGGGTGRG